MLERPVHLNFPRAAAFVLALASATAAAPAALAQTSGEKAAAAQALFDEAMRLMKADQALEACPKLEEAQRLDAGMATQFRLAECYEKIGKLASAWASFIAVADSAGVAKLPDRELAARKRAEALASRLSRLTLTIPPAVAALDGVEVLRDGGPLGRPLWGVPMPIDPGEHVVIVRAPGKKPWEGRITAGDTAGMLTLAVQPLEDLPRGAIPAPHPRKARSAVPAIVLGSVAVAGVGAGVALFVVHSGLKSDAESLSAQIKAAHGTCASGAPVPVTLCSQVAQKASSSDTMGNLSTVGFALGGAAAAATIGYLLWPQAAEAPATGRGVRLFPTVGEGRGGVLVTGSF